jgi:hypothetical protein
MNSKRQGLSNRGYAEHARVSAAYVQKLVTAGKIPTLRDGSLDPRVCDAMRAKRTRVGRGKRRRGVQCIPDSLTGSYGMCQGCGEYFSIVTARDYGSPDPQRFCTRECCNDAASGLSIAQVRRRMFREVARA